MADTTSISFSLTAIEAMALAQFIKRAHLDTARLHAADEEEAYSIQSAWMRLQQGLSEAGFSPR